MNTKIKPVYITAALAVASLAFNAYQFSVNHRLESVSQKLDHINTVTDAYDALLDKQEMEYQRIANILTKYQLNETDAESISNRIEIFASSERAFNELSTQLEVSIYEQAEIRDLGERIAKGPLLDRLRSESGIIESGNMRLVTFSKFLGSIDPEWIALGITEDCNLRSTPEHPNPPLEGNVIDNIKKESVSSCSLLGLSEDKLWVKVTITHMKGNVEETKTGWVVRTLIQFPSIGPYSYQT